MKRVLQIIFGLCFANAVFGQTNTFPATGNAGIGTTSPAAKLSFNNVNDGTNQADGITWYNPYPLQYGIYRTAGSWVAPDYQQLKVNFETGIILNPGTGNTKSYVDVQGGGLRVSSGNVGIGTLAPVYKLHVFAPADDWKAKFEGPDGYITIGPANSGWAHIYTDRPAFLFNQNVWSMPGGFSSYGQADLSLRTNGVTRVTVSKASGNVGIGTSSPNELLTVNGTIYGKEVKVDLSVPGPDYVFGKEYNLPSLDELKAFIDRYNHLPDVPSAKEMEENGIKLGEMNMILLKKMEEMTLYMIEQKKQLEEQAREIQLLKEQIN